MQTLKDLLEQAKVRHGDASGRHLAGLTSKREHKIDRTQVNAILSGTYKHRPNPNLVRAVAWLAGVDEEVAFRAAQRPVPGPPFADELPPDVDRLGPQQRQAVITMIRAFLSAMEDHSEGVAVLPSGYTPTDADLAEADAAAERHLPKSEEPGPESAVNPA